MKHHGSMNRLYRLVWSRARNAWVAVAETARGPGKESGRKLIAAALSLSAAFVQAAPMGGELASGTGSIAQSGSTTIVTQSSPNLSLTWKSFNIAPQETVSFRQPSASAIAVNRIFDTSGTQILGRLTANGQVWLINPNGILFGAGSQVNVGALVASTLNLNDAAPGGNARTFGAAGPGSVLNQGTITAADGGYVALLGNHVGNQGTIIARLGSVALGAGSAATLEFSGNRLVRMQVDRSVLNSHAENGGLIRADGGMVVMNAGAKDALLASVVNNTGVIEARTVGNHEGVITLLGGMTAGTANVGGTLDAGAPDGGNGGFIETSAAQVKIANDAAVTTAAAHGKAGTWLIDPVDFTIAAAGGNMTGSAVTNALAGGNVTILSSSGTVGTAGNVNVNDVVSWNANTLTLTAANNVNINAVMTAGGSAGLALNPATANGADAAVAGGTVLIGTSNGSFTGRVDFSSTGSLSIGGVAHTVINTLGAPGSTTGADLQGMNGNLAGRYVLGSDIDAAATSGWNAGAGFAPVGVTATRFTGTFDGLGHAISGLTINRAVNDVGLFGANSAASFLRNVALAGNSTIGAVRVGALVGQNDGRIANAYATGHVGGTQNVGGLVGSNLGTGVMSNVWATGNVRNVSGTLGFVGGLVGNTATGGKITNAYATGNVSGTGPDVGGLVGFNSNSLISKSYATGNVTGTTIVGGLVGFGFGTVTDSYATGNVTGTGGFVGGLVAYNDAGRTITNSYATGSVSGASNVGGLVGRNLGTVVDSYWNSSVTATGIASGTTTGAIGRTSAQMMQMASFTGFDIAGTAGSTAVWRIYEGSTTPWLTAFLTPLTVTAASGSKAYDGTAAGIGVSYSRAPDMNRVLGTPAYTGAGPNVGTYVIAPGGLHSVQQGYDIAYVNGALTIEKAHLTVRADDQSRLQGAVNPVFTSTLSGFVNGETAGTAAGFAGAGEATSLANAATPAGTALITATAGTLAATNYDFLLANGTLTINPNAVAPAPDAAPAITVAAVAPAPVDAAPAQMQSIILSPQAGTKPSQISLSPTLSVTEGSGSEAELDVPTSAAEARWHVAIAGGDASSSGSGNGTVVNTMMTVGGGRGPSLRIQGGGMKLPGRDDQGDAR
jgi:filamentous hemagglutinin family protein